MISDSIQQALSQGYNPDDVLNEIANQNPGISPSIQAAKSQGHQSQDILQEIARQNSSGQPTPPAVSTAPAQPKVSHQGVQDFIKTGAVNGAQAPSQNIVSNLSSAIDEGGNQVVQNIGHDFMNRAQNIVGGIQDAGAGKQSPVSAGIQTAGNVAGAVGDIFSEALKPSINQAANALSSNPTFQKVANSSAAGAVVNPINDNLTKYAEWARQHPEASRNLESAVNIGSLLLGEKPVGEAADTAGGLASKAADTVGDSASNLTKGIQNVATDATDRINATKSALADSMAQKQGDLIDERLGLNNNTKQAINQRNMSSITGAKTPGQTLVDNRIPFDETAIPLLDEHIATVDATRRALLGSEAKLGSLDDAAIEAKQNLNMQGTDKLKAQAIIDKELQAYKGQYNKVATTDSTGKFLLPQEQMDKVKSGLYQQSYGKGLTQNDSIANQARKSFANAIKNSIENNSENPLIKDLNRQEGDFINTKKMLAGKDINTLKQTSKTTALGNRIIGGLVGSNFGPVGTFAGEYLGGKVGDLLTSLPGDIRQRIINNLYESPEGQNVLSKAWETISQRQAEQMNRPALPPAPPLGTEKNPIITPPPADKSGMTILEPQNGVARDPKTGRMIRYYKSTPK